MLMANIVGVENVVNKESFIKGFVFVTFPFFIYLYIFKYDISKYQPGKYC